MISRLVRNLRVPQMVLKANAHNWGDVDKIHPILVFRLLILMILGLFFRRSSR